MDSSTLQCELLSEAGRVQKRSEEGGQRAEAGRDCKCNEDEHRNLSEYIRVVLFLSFFFFFFFKGFWGWGGASFWNKYYIFGPWEKKKLGWEFYCKEKL
jgi:hypothetical protein